MELMVPSCTVSRFNSVPNWVSIPARMLNENAVEMSAKQLAQNRRFALIVWFMFVGLVRGCAIFMQLKLKKLDLLTKLNCGN